MEKVFSGLLFCCGVSVLFFQDLLEFVPSGPGIRPSEDGLLVTSPSLDMAGATHPRQDKGYPDLVGGEFLRITDHIEINYILPRSEVRFATRELEVLGIESD